jgi:hypothetical protein
LKSYGSLKSLHNDFGAWSLLPVPSSSMSGYQEIIKSSKQQLLSSSNTELPKHVFAQSLPYS